jgi:hypothetical protein
MPCRRRSPRSGVDRAKSGLLAASAPWPFWLESAAGQQMPINVRSGFPGRSLRQISEYNGGV